MESLTARATQASRDADSDPTSQNHIIACHLFEKAIGDDIGVGFNMDVLSLYYSAARGHRAAADAIDARDLAIIGRNLADAARVPATEPEPPMSHDRRQYEHVAATMAEMSRLPGRDDDSTNASTAAGMAGLAVDMAQACGVDHRGWEFARAGWRAAAKAWAAVAKERDLTATKPQSPGLSIAAGLEYMQGAYAAVTAQRANDAADTHARAVTYAPNDVMRDFHRESCKWWRELAARLR